MEEHTMVSKRIRGYISCGIYCDTCADNYNKKFKHGCERYPQKITNSKGIDSEERILERIKNHPSLAHDTEQRKVPCPNCGANMEYKKVSKYHNIGYYKCPKCHWVGRL